MLIGDRLMKRYDNRIPVVFECGEGVSLLQDKYMVEGDRSFGELIAMIRKDIRLSRCQAIFALANNTLIPQVHPMKQVYDEHHSEVDHILYIRLVKENTFG